jgi:hypothetical protein
MPRPFTPLQAYQNEVFLESLGRSGNVRLSARAAGVGYGTIQHRRSAHADFAQRWEAIVVAVNARLHLAGGKRGPEAAVIASGAKQSGKARGGGREAGLPRRCAPRIDGWGLRTQGGEPIVVRTRSGRLQVRLAHPGKLTRSAEQAFLRALAATANVRLSAAAAGASPAAFYRRRRLDPAFAKEFRIALRIGYDRLEHAAMERTLQAIGMDGGDPHWLAGLLADNPIPPLSFDQAFQLLCLHRNSVRQDGDRPPGRRARIQHDPVAAFAAISRNIDAIERSARFESSGSWRHEDEAPPPTLAPLETVTGWSRASGRPPHHEGVALFGGWRIADMEKKLGRR